MIHDGGCVWADKFSHNGNINSLKKLENRSKAKPNPRKTITPKSIYFLPKATSEALETGKAQT